MNENYFDLMTDDELKEYIAEEYADMYCCSPECIDKDYLDCT